jgi:hypothetical protein
MSPAYVRQKWRRLAANPMPMLPMQLVIAAMQLAGEHDQD